MKIRLDRQLPVPAQVQIQGQIEFGMVNGDFPPGCKLPSVRELAADLGVSPVTVNEAYRNLAARGFIETIRGRGTFVRAAPTPARDEWPLLALEADVARLVRRADRAGIDRGVLLEAVGRHVSARNHGGPLRLLLVGVYEEATRAYASSLRRWLRREDRIGWTTLDRLRARPEGQLDGYDALLTLAHRRGELEDVAPGRTVLTVALVPSRRTRVALAGLEPWTRLGLVAVSAFLPTMLHHVQRFASHVEDVVPVPYEEAEGAAFEAVDVVVYGTGCEPILADLPGGVRAFEYRHEPDPAYVERTLLPALASLRASGQSEAR